MVATRSGVYLNSPSKTNQERPPAVQATPSTGRRTRSTAKQVECQSQLEDNCSRLDEKKGGLLTPATSAKKRCSRASRLHSPEQPSTPVGSIHEADVSDLESVCSVTSNTEPPATRTRTRRQTQVRNQENEEVSEAEPCSSAVSVSKSRHRGNRSARDKADLVPEAESCSSAMSESQRVTRSQRKTAFTRSSANKQTEESDLSEAESSTSTSRRASRRQMHPIPIHLDELSDNSQSPQLGRRTRAAVGKVAATTDVIKPSSCDSDGFESGPSYSLSVCRRSRTRSSVVDSDSDAMEVSSPCYTRSRGTPCSSRAASRTSSLGAPTSRRSATKCDDVVENAEGLAEDTSLIHSQLESTVTEEEAECTLLEDQTKPPEESVKTADLDSTGADTTKENKDVTNISEDNFHEAISASVCVSEPAVITKDQEEEPSAESKDGDASEMETMQETVPPSERSQPCTAVTAATCERASEMTEEAGEKQEAAAETCLSVEEEDVSTLKSDAQQVVDIGEVQAEAESSNQQHKTTEESEQQAKDAQRTVISLLDSSDHEDDFDEEEGGEMSEEEDERKGEPFSKSEAASSSVEGLFMIDTRPGQDADEQYYREEEEASKKGTGQDEEEEDFVDEEGDDDEDEDTQILFSSRNSNMKELSSRIDPGVRVKELGGLYISFDGSKSKPVSSSLQKLKEKKNQDEVMKKSVIGPDFKKKDAVPPYSESKQAVKLKRREERKKSTGDAWFNMKAPELTQELKGDLQVLKMRGSLDPKRFYKKNDRDGFPKYFQFGTVVDNPADFYHSRITKKERKRTMVEELLADSEFRHKNKKKYQQIIAEKAAERAGKKKKNKFHKK